MRGRRAPWPVPKKHRYGIFIRAVRRPLDTGRSKINRAWPPAARTSLRLHLAVVEGALAALALHRLAVRPELGGAAGEFESRGRGLPLQLDGFRAVVGRQLDLGRLVGIVGQAERAAPV